MIIPECNIPKDYWDPDKGELFIMYLAPYMGTWPMMILVENYRQTKIAKLTTDSYMRIN